MAKTFARVDFPCDDGSTQTLLIDVTGKKVAAVLGHIDKVANWIDFPDHPWKSWALRDLVER